MKSGLPCDILKRVEYPDASNDGISNKHRTVILAGDDVPELFAETSASPAVRIEKTEFGNIRAIPICVHDPQKTGWMNGGCFIWSNDSRFPYEFPIPLHDRREEIKIK